MSEEWEKFIESFFGKARTEYDGGVDLSTLLALKGEERTKAEAMLIEALHEGGYYAIIGLREILSKRAIPVMIDMIDDVDPLRQIEIAITLNKLEMTDEYIHYITAILLGDYHWTSRRTAAQRLAIYENDYVVEALFEALQDPEYLVRYAAAESILLIHGLDSERSSHEKLFKLLSRRPESGDGSCKRSETEEHKEAVQLIRKLLSDSD